MSNDKKAAKKKPEKGAAEAVDPGAEGGEGEGAPAKKKLSGKTLILFIVLPALLILGGGGAAAFMLLSGPKDHKEAKNEGGHEKPKAKGGEHGEKGGEGGAAADPVTEGDGVLFYAMPEMLVNISGGDGRPVFLKLKLTIEAPTQAVMDAIQPNLPRVTDEFQSFLRELRVDDLAGSAGAYRLRLELLRRVNMTIAPAQANGVLIEEMLVQ
jgi:flagellar protein FliL